MYCILADRLSAADYLLSIENINLNLADKAGRTALHVAAHKSNLEILKLIYVKNKECSLNLKPYLQDKDGLTALHLVTRGQKIECLSFILKNFIKREQIDQGDVHDRTALSYAACVGSANGVRLLLEMGANAGIPDIEGQTPLHWAVRNIDSRETVRLILESVPSLLNWQDHEGRTPLHIAVCLGNGSVVEELLKGVEIPKKKNSPSLKRSKSNSVLRKTSMKLLKRTNTSKINELPNNSEDQKTEINSSKIYPDPSIPDNAFRTVLHCAAQIGNPEICENLLNFCSNSNNSIPINISDSYGATCLHYAALNDHFQTLNIFLNNAKLDALKFVNHVDVDNRSALHWAVTKGSVEVISCLLSAGGDSKLADCQGNTPLHLACGLASGNSVYPEAVEVLTDFSVDAMFLSNQDSLTPLHIAAERGHMSIVKVLLENDVKNMENGQESIFEGGKQYLNIDF